MIMRFINKDRLFSRILLLIMSKDQQKPKYNMSLDFMMWGLEYSDPTTTFTINCLWSWLDKAIYSRRKVHLVILLESFLVYDTLILIEAYVLCTWVVIYVSSFNYRVISKNA